MVPFAQDAARVDALQTEFDGIHFDYSRQRVTPATVVRIWKS
jgi:hypothetical protein